LHEEDRAVGESLRRLLDVKSGEGLRGGGGTIRRKVKSL